MAGHQQARATVSDSGAQAADRRGHDRGAAGLRLDRNETEGLRVGRHDGGVSSAVPLGEACAVSRRLEADDVGDAERRGEIGEGGRLLQSASRRAAAHGDHEVLAARGIPGNHLRDSPQQHIGCLERLDTAHEQQHVSVRSQAQGCARPGTVARGEDLEVHARVDDVDVVRRSGVEIDELARLVTRVGDEA